MDSFGKKSFFKHRNNATDDEFGSSIKFLSSKVQPLGSNHE